MEKPPTVTRTGLESSGLPETSFEGSGPAPTLKSAVEEKSKEQSKPAKPVKKVKPAKPAEPVVVSKAKKLELEKYIFHAFSLGFKEPRVRSALIAKGWPKQVVDEVLREIRSKK
jgi:hypothetical protein